MPNALKWGILHICTLVIYQDIPNLKYKLLSFLVEQTLCCAMLCDRTWTLILQDNWNSSFARSISVLFEELKTRDLCYVEAAAAAMSF